MAERHIVKRIIETEVIDVPGFDPATGMPVTRKKLVGKYVFGIFSPTFSGARTCTAIVEGTFQDAVKLLRAPRTESGNTFKGFKKLKSTEA